MSKENGRWQTRQMITPEHQELARITKCHPVVAALLCSRGYETPDQIRLFFEGGLAELPDPTIMKEMLPARDRVVRAIRCREKIVIYGDYDVDGITATSTLLSGLRRLGGDVDYHIPHRTEEGYGLNRDALSAISERGASVVVSVDCGISARDEAIHASEIGLDLIITDHHQPPTERVSAVAVVNPKQPGCIYPFKELAGVGVAYQLLVTIRDVISPETAIDDLLELVAMGTIADVVPLVGPNRILVREGLRRLSQSKSIGLNALLAAAGLSGKAVSAGNVAFGLAPRINACGRIGHADLAVELLLTDDRLRASDLAERLDELNNQRQQMEQRILQEAQALLNADPLWQERPALVLGSESWHPGVIGIVASRLVEMLHRPVLLFSMDGEMAKGSGRSIKGFHLYRALESHATYLLKYGGHELAAGLSLERTRFDEFRDAFVDYARRNLSEESLLPTVYADIEIDPTQVNLELIEQLVKMEPFGMGNPTPAFMLRGMSATYTRELSQGKHFRARIRNGNSVLDAVAWRMGEKMGDFTGSLDLVAGVERNDYNGQSSVQLVLRHWRTSESSRSAMASQLVQTVAQHGDAWIFCREQREMELLREQFDWERLNDETAAGTSVEASTLPSGVFLHVRGHRLETIVNGRSRPASHMPILLLNLPYRPLASTNVKLLCGKEEITHTREKLLWLLPDRDHLATVFRWLRRVGPVELETMVAMMGECGLERSDGMVATHTIICILSELGLLSSDSGRLQLVARSAVELTDSVTFRQAQEEREAVFAWYEQIAAK